MSEVTASEPRAHEHQGPSYFLIFGALMVLTGLTVGVYYMDLGHTGGIVAAFAIASVKATLVVLYFMHLKFEVKAIYIIVGVPLLFSLILLIGLWPDNAQYWISLR